MEKTTRDSVADYLASRAATYSLLAALFRREITKELMDQLRDLQPSPDDDSLQAHGLCDLAACARSFDNDALRRARSEYARLFLGAGVTDTHNMASPYESTYTSDDHLLVQDARDDMVHLYRQEKLGISEDVGDPEDHVSFELSFASILFTRARDTLTSGEDDEALRLVQVLRSLYDDHLMQWIGGFCSDILRLAELPLYHAVARITLGFVSEEPQCLAEAESLLHDAAPPYAGLPREMEAALEYARTAISPVESTETQQLSIEEKRRAADRLFRDMAFLKRYFVKILSYCTTPRTADDVEAKIEEIMRFKTTAYTACDLRAMLTDAYCLEEIRAARDGDKALAAAASAESDGDADGDEDARLWTTSDIGRERIEEDDPERAVRELLARDAPLVSGYQNVLSAIKNGTGAFKEIESVIKATDLYQVDNYHASMFLKRLEDAGAIEWRNAWTLTPHGERALAALTQPA